MLQVPVAAFFLFAACAAVCLDPTAALCSALTPWDRHGPDEQEVIYERLPSDIAGRHVLLLDPLVGTGRTASRAVEVGSVHTSLACSSNLFPLVVYLLPCQSWGL